MLPVLPQALALNRNHAERALDWLLSHAEDADVAEPPTQEQLRQLYGPPEQLHVTTDQAITQLTEMGFPQADAEAAIHR